LPGIGYVVISAVSIILALFGMGQIFFESALLGITCFAAGTGGVWFVVRKI